MSGLEVAGLVFGVASAADLCLKMFSELKRSYNAYRSSSEDIDDSMKNLELRYQILEIAILAVRADAINMSSGLQIWFEEVFHRIQTGITAVLRQLERTISAHRSQTETPRSSLSKLSKRSAVDWVFNVRESIKDSTAKIDSWHQLVNTGLITLSASRSQLQLDEHTYAGPDSNSRLIRSLRAIVRNDTSVTAFADLSQLPESLGTVSLTRKKRMIPGCSAFFEKTTTGSTVVRDTVRTPPGVSATDIWSASRHLTAKLRVLSSEDSGILECVDLHNSDQSTGANAPQLSLLFNVPRDVSEKYSSSLRAALADRSKEQVPLNDRLELAKQLATSIVYLHTAAFVHKNIRPETILLLRRSGSAAEQMGRAYLVGFEQLRSVDAQSHRIGDDAWYKDIYRHPTRQGVQPEERYSMHHDIYSLGVCMLEIGLWQSLITWQEFDTSASTGPGLRAAQQTQGRLDRLAVDSFLQQFDNMLSSTMQRPTFALGGLLKEVLEILARQILPSQMGRKYAAVVTSCLRCLDPDNEDFGDLSEFHNDDGTNIGTRYLETVILQLDEIVL